MYVCITSAKQLRVYRFSSLTDLQNCAFFFFFLRGYSSRQRWCAAGRPRLQHLACKPPLWSFRAIKKAILNGLGYSSEDQLRWFRIIQLGSLHLLAAAEGQ